MKIKCITIIIAVWALAALSYAEQITIWDRIADSTTVGAEARDSLMNYGYTVTYDTQLEIGETPPVLIVFAGNGGQSDTLTQDEHNEFQRILGLGGNVLLFGFSHFEYYPYLGFYILTAVCWPADSAWGLTGHFLEGMTFRMTPHVTCAISDNLFRRVFMNVNHQTYGCRGVWYINDYGTKIVTINLRPETILREPGFNTKEELYLRIINDFFCISPVGIADTYTPPLPSGSVLHQSYPNPFNASTTIKYQMPEDAYVTIQIYDMLGRMVDNLVDEYKQAGYYQVTWNAGEQASGVYFYRIQAGNFSDIKKLTLIR